MRKISSHLMAFFMAAILVIGIVVGLNAKDVKAASKSVKKDGVVYKVSDGKKLTAKVVSSSKNITRAAVKDEIKIGKKTYKVVMISDKAFQNAKKLTSVIIGKNVTQIGKNAFQNDKKLKKITIRTRNLKKIGKFAFSGINKNAQWIVPYGTLKKMNKLIKKKNIGYKKTMKIIEADKDADEQVEVEGYLYSIKPIVDTVCVVLYVKTDNPDPHSFIFVDDDTVYSDKTVSIEVAEYIYADVKYENEKIYRVQGGYLFGATNSDGGQLKLKLRKQGFNSYKYKDSGVTFSCQKLISTEQYLVDTYTNDSMTFFEKMSAVSKGLYSIGLYSGSYVFGELEKDEKHPYFGLSTSPYADQEFLIQSPYYEVNKKPMLVTNLFPFIRNSIQFPSELISVAKLLDPNVKFQWHPYVHSQVFITHDGETRLYGGACFGGGQGIKEDMINHQYTFDGTENDFSTKKDFKEIKAKICEYGAMTVPSDIPENEKITWKQVNDTVGEGSYVQLLVAIGTKSVRKGYSFLTDNGSESPGCMSGCWYDGRYFNCWEFFEKGTKFADHPNETIVIKDYVAKLPEPEQGQEYVCMGGVELSSVYDEETGTWKGYNIFVYNSKTDTWKNYKITNVKIKDVLDYNSGAKSIEDEAVLSMFTLTREQVNNMNIDCNADVDPTDYYIYDMSSPPGTKVGN